MSEEILEAEFDLQQLDLEGPIDLEKLKLGVKKYGTLRISKPNGPMVLTINIGQHEDENGDLDENSVCVSRTNGLSNLHWIIRAEDLENFRSINGLFSWIESYGYDCSKDDRLEMGIQIRAKFGKPFDEISKASCKCDDCAKELGNKEMWQQVLLTNLALNLNQREKRIEEIEAMQKEIFSEAFHLGYSTGRLFSEYMLKEELEPHALQGMKARSNQSKRTLASGQKSSGQRYQRMRAMLVARAILVSENPAFKKMPEAQISKMAIEHAANTFPDLFKTGRGQHVEYWDYIKSDPDLSSEYQSVLNPPKEKNA